MKKIALSIKNPVSYLVCSGIKWVENRSWNTDYRGRIYIHSSTMNDYSFIDSSMTAGIEQEYRRVQGELKGKPAKMSYIKEYVKEHGEGKWFDVASFAEGTARLNDFYGNCYGDGWEDIASDIGAQREYFKTHDKGLKGFSIIGHVDLVNVVQGSDSFWAEKSMYHWILDNPVLYHRPITNIKGKLRFFDVTHIDFPDD